MGNPIFLAAYLLMTVPFTRHRLGQRAVELISARGDAQSNTLLLRQSLATVGYALALGLQLGAIGFWEAVDRHWDF